MRNLSNRAAVVAALLLTPFAASAATYGDFSLATKNLVRQFKSSGVSNGGRAIFVSSPENVSFMKPDEERLSGFAARELSRDAGFTVVGSEADADFVWKLVVSGSTDADVSLSAAVSGRSGTVWSGTVPVGAPKVDSIPSRHLSGGDVFATRPKTSGSSSLKVADMSVYPGPVAAGGHSHLPSPSYSVTGVSSLGGMTSPTGMGGTSVLSSLFSLVWSGDSSRKQERGFLGRYVADVGWRYRKNDDVKSAQNFDFGGRTPLFGSLDFSLRGFLDWDDQSENSAMKSVSGKELTAYGADALLQYSFRRSEVWNPYAGLGIQWVHADFGPSRMLGGSSAYYEMWRQAVREYNRMAAAAGSDQRIREGGDSFCPIFDIGLEVNVTRTFSLRGDFQYLTEGLGNKNDFADDPREFLSGRADWLLGEKFAVGASVGYEFEDKTLSFTAAAEWVF